MNNKKILELSAIIASSLAVLLIIIFSIYGVVKTKGDIKSAENEIKVLDEKLNKEIKNKKIINETDKDFLENAYFDREKDIFENYIRSIFKKYNTDIKVYHSKLDEKDYAEINLTYNIYVVDFFRLIKSIENGKRLVIIKSVNINRINSLKLDVKMTLGAYYN